MSAALLGSRYLLEEPIGRGGMASVWRALDTVLERPVAIKRLHARVQDDPELAERFRREAQVVARLSHPHLVHLLDRGEEAGTPYLVFELVEGQNLKARIREHGPLPPDEAARICAQVARALAYAHARGVIHRDNKAHNVLLTDTGEAKLADFGIARILGAPEDSSLTATGMLLGTSDYLSPEQAEGRAVDGRTDVYSLGIVLYECLTGRLPFSGDGWLAVAMQHVREPLPDPRTLVPELPPHLAAAALQAAAKEPDRRFQRADELALALELGPAEGFTARLPVPSHALPPLEPGPSTTAPTAAPAASSAARTAAGHGGRRRRMRGAAWGAALLGAAGAAVAGLWALGALPGIGPSSSSAARATPLALASVASYDPLGDDRIESPEEVPFVTDGNPATSWHTANYRTALFGNLKTGVGLELTLPTPARPSELDLVSPSRGGSFELLGPLQGGMGPRPVLGRGAFTGGPVHVRLERSDPGTSYVLWITSLPADPEGGFRAAVAEVSLRGAANS
ncbi:MAG: eukaryotic-like serine/threonine-protein kinase [Miltoncostaeaceae bacterium]|nr:eukaryotic-like serine/threonine-protein kinase [Miltoncostaeaceae bacterium]